MDNAINLNGQWLHQSFLIPLTAAETDAPAGAEIDAWKWAKGTLTIFDSAQDSVSGELVFASTRTISLSVKGKIFSAAESNPAVLEATAKGESGIAAGALYKITGWIISPNSGKGDRPTIRGAILSVTPDLAGKPSGTVGSFVLSPI
jgi:hypothetical protein